VVWLTGCYLFSGLIKEFFTSSVLWLLGLTPSVVWLKGFIPIRGLFEGLYPHQWFVRRALPRQCFDSSPEMLPPIKNVECLYCGVGLLPFWTCPILSQRSYHYTILWVSYMFIHSCICSMHTNIIHAWLHCQSYFNCTKGAIHNVSKSEMLPIMYISSGGSHQNSRLPMPFHFPSVFSSVGRYPIEVIDGISFRVWVIIPVKVIDSLFLPSDTYQFVA